MASAIILLGAMVSAALVTWLLTPWAARCAMKIGAVDRPGERKVHRGYVPRLGGLAILAGLVLAALIGLRARELLEVQVWGWLGGAIVVFAVISVVAGAFVTYPTPTMRMPGTK